MARVRRIILSFFNTGDEDAEVAAAGICRGLISAK